MESGFLYSSCSLQLRIPEEVEKEIQQWSLENIKDDDLFIDPNDPVYGRTLESHITIGFGLKEKDFEEIKKIFEGSSEPLKIEFGKIQTIKNPKCNVVWISVHPNESLKSLYVMLRPFMSKTGRFNPYCTIAFTKSRTKIHRASYAKKFEITNLEFVWRTGEKTSFLL
eukprot:TRINITY_DN15916_c0_g1_i1.p1 TRINITY_DN15916_c0_g1~~TRINITY_DN15916_c0_g1_i1.p1  ORF type:complete len:168 (+),score=30.79 TRINITY_DN15916_c0_g1_i1:66-569(+)